MSKAWIEYALTLLLLLAVLATMLAMLAGRLGASWGWNSFLFFLVTDAVLYAMVRVARGDD